VTTDEVKSGAQKYDKDNVTWCKQDIEGEVMMAENRDN